MAYYVRLGGHVQVNSKTNHMFPPPSSGASAPPGTLYLDDNGDLNSGDPASGDRIAALESA